MASGNYCHVKLNWKNSHDILHFMVENIQTDAIFLDFRKASDRVPHNQLISKPHNLGIPLNIIFWVENFLTNRKQYTSANTYDSPLPDVTSGIAQGTCLSPTSAPNLYK